MFERLSTMGSRAKALTLGALVVMLPLGIWVGYNLGRWVATH